jgi:hypothetical protein
MWGAFDSPALDSTTSDDFVFPAHISLRLDCWGGAGFMDFGISRNFPESEINVFLWSIPWLLAQCLLTAHGQEDALDACDKHTQTDTRHRVTTVIH